MAVKIRLARRGRKKRPYYHIIIADGRAPRDGKFIEQIGSYNPMTKPATIEIDRDKAFDWLEKGAQPTDTVRAILRFKGVMYRKHLQRGVSKGAMTQEVADAKLAEWIEAKEAKVAARVEETKKEMEEFRKLVSGEAKAKVAAPAAEADAAAFREDTPEADAPVAEEATAAVEEVAEEAAPVVEEAKAAVVEAAAPVVEEVAEVVEEAAPAAETPADDAPAEDTPAV